MDHSDGLWLKVLRNKITLKQKDIRLVHKSGTDSGMIWSRSLRWSQPSSEWSSCDLKGLVSKWPVTQEAFSVSPKLS